MKKLILISLLSITPVLFAGDLDIRIQTPLSNGGNLDIGFRSDDHRYNDRYRNFDYHRHGYFDDYGYYFGYFDRSGYFYNNIFFLYDNRYTYYDRLHRRGHFKPSHPHYRKYVYHKHNDWNRTHQFRDNRQPVYGPYYDKHYVKQKNHHDEHRNYREHKDDRGFHR